MIKIRGTLEEGENRPPPRDKKNGEEPILANYSDALNIALKKLEEICSGDDYK
jgi:hypothetical protein